MTAIADPIVEAIDTYHASQQDLPRQYLGASVIGHECDRWLWLSFRWAVVQRFEGRIKRLFRRGQHEETWVVADLRAADYTVSECLQHQKHHTLAPHIGCTPDGVIVGLAEAHKKRHSLEIKTHSAKSFASVQKDGVEKSQPKHYAQMQMEMLAQETDRALYVAICKDNDEIYTERVKLDKMQAENILERGKRIVFSERMPEPLSADPSWYQCKFCQGHDLCHVSKLTREVNCRTCAHSTATQAGTWTCARFECEIPTENQRDGCDCHVLHPDLVPWQLDMDSSTETDAVWIIEGKPVRNGEPCANVFGSKELIANAHACANADEIVIGMREEFGGRIVG
jgi:hypothetical protein